MPSHPNQSLNRLLRGISTGHVQTVRQAWRELLDKPDSVTPLVCEKLSSAAWTEKPRGPSDKYLGILLALLHELDLEKFRIEIQRLRAEPLHPFHHLTVEIMAQRDIDQMFGTIDSQVPVYISDEIAQPDMVFRYLQSWSRTRDLAFSKVTRIDVIAFRSEMDYLGLYNLFYDGIVLTWRNGASAAFPNWWRKMQTELTFYHEIGHHYFQHSEHGQVEEQEQEANEYMRRMFRNAHPVLTRVARVMFSPVFLFVRLRKHWRKTEMGHH